MTYLNIRITEQDKHLLKKYAGKYRMQLSSYVRYRLLTDLTKNNQDE